MKKNNVRIWWRRLPALVFGLAGMAAFTACPVDEEDCNSQESEEGCDTEELANPLLPGWYQSQEFHLETRYWKAEVRTERGDRGHDFEGGLENVDTMDLDDQWSEPMYWRYQVLDTGLTPAEGEDFYEYATMGGTTSPLTIIKASLDETINLGQELLETDPKVYLVIREDRLRLAALVYYYTVNDERFSDAISIDPEDINKSYSKLSQSSLTVIPHFIPPYPLEAENGDRVLEDGQVVSLSNATTSSVDVVYDNLVDGGYIAETWEEGQPWALASVTPSTESRLMSATEVDDLRNGATPNNTEDDDDKSFVDLLRAPTSLSGSLKVSDEMIGSNTYQVGEGRKPWAGSWWRQSEAALVFSHEDSGANDTSIHTISSVGKPHFKQLGTDIQNLGDELRDIRKDQGAESEAYTTKVEEYREKQSAFVDALVGFYNAVRAGVDGGTIRVENGRVSADANWNGATGDDPQYGDFDLDLDRLSPLDKFALVQQLEGRTGGTNPWFGPAWELLNHWSPAGSGWFGHCNGWAAAAILTNEPRTSFPITFGNNDQYAVDMTVADQKGLLSETNYSTLSHFFGSRYNSDEDDVTDLSPKAVIQLIEIYVHQRGVPFVFDTTATDQVWNFPIWKYTMNLTETTSGGSAGASGLININTAGLEELQTLWGISTARSQRIVQYRLDHGPFQTIEEIVDVRGIGWGIFNRLKDNITVDAASDLRTFTGSITATFATDGVDETYVDADPESPNSFDKTWSFTLEASPAGEIITSTWDNVEEHPDFAWVPYVNTVRSGSSENPYLNWLHLKGHYLPEGIVRE